MGLNRNFLITTVLLLISFAQSAPTLPTPKIDNLTIQENLREFFEKYYNEKYVEKDEMQSDQPVDDGNNVNNVLPPSNFTPADISNLNFLQAARNRSFSSDEENRTKDNWIQMLKMNILHQVGRVNSSNAAPGESRLPPFNSTAFFHHKNDTNNQDDLISKKIRTFYPACTVPEAAEIEFQNEDKMMNLYFNYSEEDQTRKIATATIRLHRIPQENSSLINAKPKNCSIATNEEEKLLRVSIYWYIKPQRNKRRVKKRLCDSRVISENSRWVELNIANAIRAWNKEQNLGLAIQVEDPDGRTLKAEKYFKGPTCLQLHNQSQQSSWMTLELQNSFTNYWEEIQHRPFLVIYYCYPLLTFVPWDSP